MATSLLDVIYEDIHECGRQSREARPDFIQVGPTEYLYLLGMENDVVRWCPGPRSSELRVFGLPVSQRVGMQGHKVIPQAVVHQGIRG